MSNIKNIEPSDELNNFILYTAPSGEVKIEIYIQNDTIWLTQQKIADLFGVDRTVVTKHLKNIFDDGELVKDSVSAIFAHTAADGKKYDTNFYNLDAIISVGYRVNSTKATQFRIWATKTLKEYIIKGFAIDDDRLKQGKTVFGKDYFRELLERVRSIRASERRIYQQVTDIFAECSIDYDPQSPITKKFYATVQNKFHYAITGKTAAEIIFLQADSKKENMGLTTWKNAPKGKVLKGDIGTAKNYMQEKEIKELERIVTMYLDFAELQAERQIPMKMEDWAKRLDAFLQFNEYNILKDAGKVSHDVAMKLAEKEYEKFRVIQDQNFVSDFEKEVKKISKPTKSDKKKK